MNPILGTGSTDDGVARPQRLSAGVISAYHLEALAFENLVVLSGESAPRVLGIAALEQNGSKIRQQPKEPSEGIDAGLPFGGVRGSIDVPGIGIPRCDIVGADAHLFKGAALKFGCGVVVLHAKEARTNRATLADGHID